MLIDDTLCAVLRGESIDWPDVADEAFYIDLLARAAHHGVGSLLCHTLKSSNAWKQVPDRLQKPLLLQLRNGVAFEMLRAKDLVELNKSFELAGIPMLVLKGAALAYSHYAEPYLRARGDTDIFIRLEDIRKSRAVFSQSGYELRGPVYKSHQFNAFKPGFAAAAINYDVHWRTSNGASYARIIGFESAQANQVMIPGLEGVGTLSPALSLMQACIHRVANPDHDADRLIWIYDIHLLVSAMPPNEFVAFAEQARDAGIQHECRSGIEKAHECFATSLLDEAMVVLAKPVGLSGSGGRFAASTLGLIVDDLKLLGMRDRLELIREYVFPSSEYLLGRYQKKGVVWVPLLYLRYLLVGAFERLTLR